MTPTHNNDDRELVGPPVPFFLNGPKRPTPLRRRPKRKAPTPRDHSALVVKKKGAEALAAGASKPKNGSDFSPGKEAMKRARAANGGKTLSGKLAKLATGIKARPGGTGSVVQGALSGAAVGASIGEAVSKLREEARKARRDRIEANRKFLESQKSKGSNKK